MIVSSSQKVISNQMIISIHKTHLLMIVEQASWYVYIHEWDEVDEL